MVPFVVPLLLAAASAAPASTVPASAAPAAATAAPAPARLPPEDLVRALRLARIEALWNRPANERRLLDEALAKYPDEPAAFLALFDNLRRSPADATRRAEVRTLLRPLLERADREIPPGLLQLLVRDREIAPEDLDLVATHLAAWTTAHSGDTVRLGLLAEIHLRRGRLAEAREALEALRTASSTPWVSRQCAELDLALGRLDSAARLASALDPDQRRDLEFRLALRTGTPEALAAALESVQPIHPAPPAPRPGPSGPATPAPAGGPIQLGGTYAVPLDEVVAAVFTLQDAGRTAEAEKMLRRLAVVAPAPEVNNLVVALYGSAEERGAAAAREAKLAPADALNAGALKLAAGDAAAAFDLLQRAYDGLPASDVAAYNFGIAAQRLKRWDVMDAASSRAMTLRPGWVEAQLLRAEARTRAGRFREALDDLLAVDRARPNLKNTWALFVDCHKGLGDMKSALAAYEKYKSLP